MSKSVYQVKGIHCQSCVANISEGVREVPGVVDVTVDLGAEKVVVDGDGFTDEAVRQAIAAAGYATV